MRWIKAPFLRSVKFKIAAVYAALLTMSFLVLCVVFAIYSRVEIYTLVDRDLGNSVERLSYEYITGGVLPSEYGAVDSKRARYVGNLVRRDLNQDFRCEIVFENLNTKSFILIGQCGNELMKLQLQPGKAPIAEKFVRPAGSEKKIDEFVIALPSRGRQYEYFWMCDTAGKNVFGSGIKTEDHNWIDDVEYKQGSPKVRFDSVSDRRHRLRVAYRTLPDMRVLAVARSLHDFDSGIERMLIVYLAIAGGVLLVSFVCSYLIACRLCRGVEAVSAAADAIANGDYSRRVVPHNSGSEIDRMMINFNTMIGNTEKLMEELRTISDNIAHDLRTPLTRMLGRAELTVTGEMSREDYENAFAANVEECRRMLTLINTMLDITRTESGTDKLQMEKFDQVKLLDQTVGLFGMLADQKQISLKCRVPEMPVIFYGDRIKIQQLIANLLDNAVKFTGSGGMVEVGLQLEHSSVTLSVRDSGCGMNEQELQQVFKRFYRADSSRTLPGNGLGLSLVQAIVTAHNGTVEISSQTNEGTFVWVKLPLQN